MAKRQFSGNESNDARIQFALDQFYQRQPGTLGDGGQRRLLRAEAQLDENLVQRLSGRRLHGLRGTPLFVTQQIPDCGVLYGH
ncbi:MAG: hypothetical protein BWY76_03269 [bacterium ADurb.Bin429]|nr:MAG: hypothetical protein BWY76_03269 [bacterium ADurb.Bin429]